MVPVLIGSGAVAPALSLQAAALSPRKGPGVLRTPALIGGVAQLPRVRAVVQALGAQDHLALGGPDRKSSRLNSSHVAMSYAVFCLKQKACTWQCARMRLREST